MFEIKIDNAKYWRDCVESIVSLVDEGSFNISKEGIALKAMDPTAISMVSFFMPSKAFSKFSVEKNVNVGLNLESLSKILSGARESESLTIKDADSKVALEFVGPNSKRRYKMQQIEISKSVDKEPSVEFDSKIEINGEPLKDIIKDASLIRSYYITFRAAKSQFMVRAESDEGQELEEQYDVDGSVVKKVDASKNAEALFNLEFLENMVKSCPTGSAINISLKTNELLRLNYTIGDASVTYYLAPYIKE